MYPPLQIIACAPLPQPLISDTTYPPAKESVAFWCVCVLFINEVPGQALIF